MTVQELINKLMEVEDKNIELTRYCGNGKLERMPELWLEQKTYMDRYGYVHKSMVVVEGD